MNTGMKRLPSKLLTFLITILLITFIAFALLRLASSDPAEIQLARTGVTYTAERLEALRRELGLDAPFLLQYFRWLGGLVQGDLGLSMSTGLPVASQLFSALPNTLLLSGITLAISAVVSLALGILCALRQGSLFDRFVMALTNALAALPGYFISLVLLYVFALKLRLFSVLITSVTLKSLILPAAALSIGLIPPYVRQIRATLAAELVKPYVLGARSRGVRESRIFFFHLLRNSALPLLSMAGISLSVTLGGSIIIESIFGWPGLGLLAMNAVSNRDYTMLQGYIVFIASACFILNSLIDFLGVFLDPRQEAGEAANG